MHKFVSFLTKYKVELLKDGKFVDLQKEKKEFAKKSEFDTAKEELKTKITDCLSIIKKIIKDDEKRSAFNADNKKANPNAIAINYDEKSTEIVETNDSEWSQAEYDMLEKYSENSNTIYISLGEIVGEYKFCEECIFFEDDEEKSIFSENEEDNKKIIEEMQKSAQTAVNENKILKKRYLVEVFIGTPTEDDIEFAVYNMNPTEFGAFIAKPTVKDFAKSIKDKFKETTSFNPYEKIKSGVTGALATGADAIANKAAIQTLTSSA